MPKQAGETHNAPQSANGRTPAQRVRDWARWMWVEQSVWTPRMLEALARGVKGGKWFSLWDKVWAPATLEASFARTQANKGKPGVDGVTIERFGRDLGPNIAALSELLRTGGYQPQKIRRTYIPKAGSTELRPLGIPTVRDRIVQGALRSVLEPIFERDFADHSYGFRPRLGCKDALRRVDELLNGGYAWVVDADIKGYFDTIPHEQLMALVEKKVSDGKVLALLRAYLKAGILDGMKTWEPTEGTPQGAVVSPLLSNIYLDPLDHLMAGKGYEMVRYADDFVVLCRSQEEAQAALSEISAWMAEAELTLHPTKTRLVDATLPGGFEFLGYHFERGKKWPRKKSQDKLKDTIRAKTRRANGQSMERTIKTVNQSLHGWFEYFKLSVPGAFKRLDEWIRMRLRSILRKRERRRGPGKGSAHRKWPNDFFARLGLFSMVEARKSVIQPA